jgi:hypothetical protein
VACGGIRNFYAAPHTHAQETNIPQHSPCGKNRSLHKKQAPKHNTNTKQNNPQTQTCGRLKISTHRKEKATPFIGYREVAAEQQTHSQSCLGGWEKVIEYQNINPV